MSTWYYARLTGTGAPFSLISESWTQRTPATLGLSHYNAMMGTLATLSGEIQGDFNAANRDSESARKGVSVAQGPDYDFIDGNETGDGFGYTSTLTTSSTQTAPQNVNNMSWYPVAHRPWAIGTDEGTGSGAAGYGDRTAVQAHSSPEGGSDPSGIIFSKASWDACRTDLEEFINDITNFWSSMGSDVALTMMTLESFDEGKGIFWLSDPPYLSPYRYTGTGDEDLDHAYWKDDDPTASDATFYWQSAQNLNVTANQNEFTLWMAWHTSGSGANIQTSTGSRAIAFTGNSGSYTATSASVNDATYPEIHVGFKRKADGALRQLIKARKYTGVA
jgi:hypothetical protein